MKKGDYHMEITSVNTIINNAVIATREEFKDDKKIIKGFIDAIRLNKELFLNSNMVDTKNNNGFKIDINVIDRILNKYENMNSVIGDNNVNELSDDLLKSKIYDKLGVVLVLFDGNFYTMLEMMLLGLYTHNAMIFDYDGYMWGSNTLLINIVEAFFKKQGMDEKLFQQSESLRVNEFFNNNKSIDKTVIIGNQEFVDKYIKECTTEVIVSRYNNYDLYIEDITHKDLIDKILGLGMNLNLYVRDDIEVDYDATIVGDVDEAISYINSNGSKNASSIFSSDNDNINRFIKNVKSKRVYLNTNPSYEDDFDIKQIDLLREKVIVVPNMYDYK